MSAAGVVVIGLGNVVCSDDGVGVQAVARLRERFGSKPDVTLVEGGTAGLLLLPHLADARRAIIVDAIDVGAEPGTLVRLGGDELARAFSAGATVHDVGLRDLLGAARLSGAWPEQLVLHGVQPGSTTLGTELTPTVAAALDGLVDGVAGELAAWGAALLHAGAASG
jgi:hydrogenase maturation protease